MLSVATPSVGAGRVGAIVVESIGAITDTLPLSYALSRPEESCAPGSLDEIVCFGYSLPEMEELMDGGVSLLVAEASIG